MAGAYPPAEQEREVELNQTLYRVRTRVKDEGGSVEAKRIVVQVNWAKKGTVEVRQESVRARVGE